MEPLGTAQGFFVEPHGEAQGRPRVRPALAPSCIGDPPVPAQGDQVEPLALAQGDPFEPPASAQGDPVEPLAPAQCDHIEPLVLTHGDQVEPLTTAQGTTITSLDLWMHLGSFVNTLKKGPWLKNHCHQCKLMISGQEETEPSREDDPR